ncbi:MAG: hypothetical protein B9J98_07660 [Candidatus Terraquivivens tikiterensis]|uniref:Uncharacterized protein n=1 Tax=Candidatus Terraquivivens tikiterensis TaxID=1980982 RepID=A0A2R7Y0P9_9ARCH|nr:MAG: hypothetical protein B9J98_07660 [Candidatus Terraquivivens tikiterensis]
MCKRKRSKSLKGSTTHENDAVKSLFGLQIYLTGVKMLNIFKNVKVVITIYPIRRDRYGV